MYKFLLKKSFFDGWDSILILFLLNAVFFVSLLLVFISQSIVMIPVCVLIFSFHLCGVTGATYNMTRNQGAWFAGYKRALKKLPHFVLFYFAVLIETYIFAYVVPLYLYQESFIWYAMGFFLLFLGLIGILGLMYYYPLCFELDNDKPFIVLKKCFVVLFDNFLFSIFCFIKNICDLAISLFMALLMPGFAGVAITMNNAVYFFMLKYDWIDENKVDKNHIHTSKYLEPIEEMYSERNLKNLFFPWKQS